MRRAARLGVGVLIVAALVLGAWSIAIGPVSAWRVLTHGTTTIWDHLEYPGRDLSASPAPQPWLEAPTPLAPPEVVVDGQPIALPTLLTERDTLAFLVTRGGEIGYEWYAADHLPDQATMVFSVTKSIFSLLVGAALDDGLLGSVDDPVTSYLPEIADRGFEAVTLEDLLRMDSNLDYVEGDNPFGIHVEFNYTPDLAAAITDLGLRSQPDEDFRYKSGDNALLGLILNRALGQETVTGYFERRLWHPLGAEAPGRWSVDREGGLERTWCCLALTARDLARFGQLVLDDGRFQGEQLLSSGWLEQSFQPGFEDQRWPTDYAESPLLNYGYHWWLTAEARVALGKGGQYLYIDPARQVVVVRLGETAGDLGWIDVLRQVAHATGSTAAESSG